MAHDPEIRKTAQDLYVLDGMTLEQVAHEMDVPERTVQKWSVDDGWKKLKIEHEAAGRLLQKNLLELRQNMMRRAAANLDPQDVYAVIRLEKLAQERKRKAEGDLVPDIDRPKIFLEDMEFVAEVLREIDPEGLKVLARNFEVIVERFKEKSE